MIFVIVCAVALGCIFYKSSHNKFDAFCGGIIGYFCGIMLWFSVGALVGAFLPTVEVLTVEDLLAVNKEYASSCKKFLRAEHVYGELVYSYDVSTDDGKLTNTVDADTAYVIEGDYKPVVQKYDTTFANKWFWLFASDLLIHTKYVEFYVPVNSLVQEYTSACNIESNS